MKLVIVSGHSGSGKSTALRALEDLGYHCIDNFPVELLLTLVDKAAFAKGGQRNLAVGVDVRSAGIEQFAAIWKALDQREDLDCEIVYLTAASPTLVKRFSETRRRHPLTDAATDLRQAIEKERLLIDDIPALADLVIDTTRLRASDLVGIIQERISTQPHGGLSLLFRSFGFKFGIPVDADMVFDLRCLPNPHWQEELRPLTGLDAPVREFLGEKETVQRMQGDIIAFLDTWLPSFEAGQQAYMTLGLGCTGGRHRSVYMAEQLAAHFRAHRANVLVRHREIKLQDASAGVGAAAEAGA